METETEMKQQKQKKNLPSIHLMSVAIHLASRKIAYSS